LSPYHLNYTTNSYIYRSNANQVFTPLISGLLELSANFGEEGREKSQFIRSMDAMHLAVSSNKAISSTKRPRATDSCATSPSVSVIFFFQSSETFSDFHTYFF
jgi:hypothetical protein